MKALNLLIAALAATLSLSTSDMVLRADEPYVPPQDIYTPRPVQAIHGTTVGVVAIPEYGNKPITIYKGSAGSTATTQRFYYEPYVAVWQEQFLQIYENKCTEKADKDDSFNLEFNVEVGSRNIATAVKQQFPTIEVEGTVGIFEYLVIELISSLTNPKKVLWRTPRSTQNLIPTDNSIEWGKVRSVSKFNCSEVRDLATYVDAMEARATLPSAMTTNRVGRITVSSFQEHLFDFSLDQDATASGSLQQISVTTTRGKSEQSPVLLRFSVGGNASGSVVSTVESTETDTRVRWMSRSAFRKATSSYVQRIGVSTWCEADDENCNAGLMENRLIDLFDTYFSPQTVKILTNDKAIQDGTDTYMLISEPKEVERLRTASMNPSFSSQVGANVDCDRLAQAAVAGTSGGTQSHGQQEGPATVPSATSPTACGLDQSTEVKDDNSVTWKYVGSEWIPTTIELAYLSEEVFNGIASNVILNTTYSGAMAVLSSIPVVRLSGPTSVVRSDQKALSKEHCDSRDPIVFGGPGGRLFQAVKPTTVQLRTGKYVDAIVINERKYGGNGGRIGDVLRLRGNEYINRVVVRAGKYVDRIELYTNKGQKLAGGGNGGTSSVLENIRVLKLGGKSGRFLDRLVVEYCVTR